MTDPTAALNELLEKHPAAPFLFVGSGFSRRYLGLEDWAGLLARFCAPIRSFGYYSAKANGDLPLTASYMASDFNEWWWSEDKTNESRERNAARVKNQSDALKVEIAEYMASLSLEGARESEFSHELAALPGASVDGVITTNWDFLLEEIFPDFKVFVGQEELLFSNPQAIGEIYKIHGSASDPSSMILTHEDYQEFDAKNPYLAAKLVTIFVEHPILFLGYSISDPHIQAIITSIARCLTQDKVDSFQQNLIFVQRVHEGEEPSMQKTTIQSDGFSVTMMVARVADYAQVYAALQGTRRKIPARILRFFKEQMYDLVHTPQEGQNKLAVIDYDEIDSTDDVEFVVGVGVAKRQQDFAEKTAQILESALAKRGYAGVSAEEIFRDCILENSQFNAADLLESAYPIFGRTNRKFIPVFRYLQSVGITSPEALAVSKYEGAKKVVGKMNGANYVLTSSYSSKYQNSFSNLTTSELIAKAADAKEALLMLPFQDVEDVDIEVLRDFLAANSEKFDADPYMTAFRKLVCWYDKLKFGF
jgi:hypothetical protein